MLRHIPEVDPLELCQIAWERSAVENDGDHPFSERNSYPVSLITHFDHLECLHQITTTIFEFSTESSNRISQSSPGSTESMSRKTFVTPTLSSRTRGETKSSCVLG